MKTNTKNQLPISVTEYIDAANRFDAAGAAACFTSDAIVRDEEENYEGAAAIESWVSETSLKYQPHLTVTNVQVFGDKLGLTVRVAGDFPGSPVELDYELRMRDGKISELNIQ